MRYIPKLTGERRDLEAFTLNGLRRWITRCSTLEIRAAEGSLLVYERVSFGPLCICGAHASIGDRTTLDSKQ